MFTMFIYKLFLNLFVQKLRKLKPCFIIANLTVTSSQIPKPFLFNKIWILLLIYSNSFLTIGQKIPRFCMINLKTTSDVVGIKSIINNKIYILLFDYMNLVHWIDDINLSI